MTIDQIIEAALHEDIGTGDHTSLSAIPKTASGKSRLIIKEEGIPNWKECKKIADQIDYLENLPEVLISRTDLLKKYCDFRIESFDLMAKSIERKTNSFKYRISICNKKIDLIIEKLKGKDVAIVSPKGKAGITMDDGREIDYPDTMVFYMQRDGNQIIGTGFSLGFIV